MKKRANDMAEQPMKVLVVSDAHGRVTPLRWLLKNETADALFFLGDGLYDLNQAIAANGAAPDYPIYRVRGNCDIGSDDPAEGLAPFGGVLFFYTHGHLFGVKSGYERIAEYAADRGAMWCCLATPTTKRCAMVRRFPRHCSTPAACGIPTAMA